jgi:uroporphyrin-III C-methyltransferase/precorrin-2 dehydrogenase/sirohydrochlorin ferrochelatase/uroporphyrin-III C-methyltransferase
MKGHEMSPSLAGAGIVHIVGAGPGDPDLLTLKALRAIEAAEVVVYDLLLSDEILALIPPGAMRIFAGKERGNHAQSQEETNRLLVKLATAGHRIVRLKGGDPLIFGRGSEEALHLAQHGIAFEIVPGITAAAGCAAAAGIPLTHRGLAKGVRFVTGHCRNDEPLDLNWESLADPETTLVIYMGLAHIAEISCRLIKAGLPEDTPAAAVAKGTTSSQDVQIASLATIADKVQKGALKAPVLFIVGEVVTLFDALSPGGAAEDTVSPGGATEDTVSPGDALARHG